MKIPTTEIIKELLADPFLEFKPENANSEYLNKGRCPQCGEHSLFVSKKKPFLIACNHRNQCGYEESVRSLLPQLFEDFLNRYPATKEEPNLTADTYLALNRGFDISKMRGWYHQDSWHGIPSIRFPLPHNGAYWERLVTPGPDGRKANFGGIPKPDGTLYRGDAWTPHGQIIEAGDRVFLVEGIFHATALHHLNIKSGAGLSCSNFPSNLIEAHKGKKITWVLALDGDKAGQEYMKRHAEKLEKMGENFEVLLLPWGKDWDDLYRAGTIDDKFVDYRLWKGRLLIAKTPEEKAFIYYQRMKLDKFMLEFENALYSFELGAEFAKEFAERTEGESESGRGEYLASDEGRMLFRTHLKRHPISNIVPRFLYIQRDEATDEQEYVFSVDYASGTKTEIVALDGTAITKPESFRNALIGRTQGGSFDGTPSQLKHLRDKWLNKRITMVRALPFVGYDKDSGAYIFQDNSYYKGREIKLNNYGYFQINKHGVRSKLAGVNLNTKGKFDPSWLSDFKTAFSWQGLAILAFFLGALFVQQIRAKHKSFPFFELTGEPGSGKSTILEFLWKLFGRDDYEGFDLIKATKAGRRRAFSQVSNLPVVIIESDRDNGIKDAKQVQFNFDEMKPFFNGRGTGTLGIANRNNDVEEHFFQGALCISQNAEVEGSEALLQRIVHCHADKKHHGPSTREIARRFERETSASVGGFLRAALAREDRILEAYFHWFDALEPRFLEKLKVERVAKNHAQVAACGYALREVFPNMEKTLCDNLAKYMLERAQAREDRLAADHPLVELFWEQFEYINEFDSKKGRVDCLNHATDEAIIAVNLNQFREYAQNSGQALIDMAQLKKLLPHSRRYKFKEANKTVNSKHNTGSIKCWIFEKGGKK